jgi:hypothetical protein
MPPWIAISLVCELLFPGALVNCSEIAGRRGHVSPATVRAAII